MYRRVCMQFDPFKTSEVHLNSVKVQLIGQCGTFDGHYNWMML